MSDNIIKDYSEYVPDVHFELIPIRNLVSNQEYQRNLSTTHVLKTANNFDLFQLNPVKVSRRDGINYVFNGQHTAEIIAMVSGSRETPVWCMIYDDLEYTEEADIFANQMKNVKRLLKRSPACIGLVFMNWMSSLILVIVISFIMAKNMKSRLMLPIRSIMPVFP